jgi:chromosome segregation ATPase
MSDPGLPEIRKRLKDTEATVKLRDTRIGELQLERDRLTETLNLREAHLRDVEDKRRLLEQRINSRESRVRDLEVETGRLTGQLEDLRQSRPRASVGSLTAQLRAAAEAANSAVAEAQAGQSVFVVERIDAELRGGLDLDDGVGLRQPGEIGPGDSSTLRIALRPATRIRLVDDDEKEDS